MTAHSPDARTLLAALHRTLVRRWVTRIAVRVMAASLWGWTAGILMTRFMHWDGYVLQIAGALFGGFVALMWIMKRIPRPSMRDAALFAEAHGDARGAVELTLANTSEHVVRQATNTLGALSTDAFPPLLTLRAAVLCGAGAMAALVLSLTLTGNDPTSYLPPEQREISQASTALAASTLSDAVLGEFRDTLLGASPDQQEAARKRYAELWGQREKQIDDLGNAAIAGHKAAAKGDAEALAQAASAQQKAVATLSSSGLPMPDVMVADSSLTSARLNAQSDAIANLAHELDGAAALAHELLLRAAMNPSPRGTLEDRADPFKPGEGEHLTGMLSPADSGVIVIGRDVWKGQRADSVTGVPMTPREAAAVDRYRTALGDK